MQYKPFLDYKDIKELFGCDTHTAYRTIDAVLENVDKARMPPFLKKVVPTDVFIKMYPSVRSCMKK